MTAKWHLLEARVGYLVGMPQQRCKRADSSSRKFQLEAETGRQTWAAEGDESQEELAALQCIR
jgi:hypothetical protein